MDSLKQSIQRDGFCAPILVRPYKRDRWEVISGNHRFMAACELGMAEIPCVVSNMDDAAAKRLAINLNTIHGEPNPELLAPFLAELDLAALLEIHIEEPMKKELLEFDINLAEMLAQMQPLVLVARLVEGMTEPGETVCDPYLGSGTTAAACLRTGRNFFGIERDPKHYATACERLAKEINGALI